ncbi:high affinity immunoglobulin alpha and immunoglobulin mu Fc receptor-like isoform X2 [Lagopus leucura]|uniref:high affinity immunoglobulin alpha and immunoglobulin mu Fc receptor-like isoform X2 n=1 Tax=Lagopus leucura TaxID=30410 RepID=UPI001C67834E|nr:high affinity immunoglobulin alpha and immunoglobulin mu Fc receptor-like isoform X2 [Lagopus leucura]
MAPGWAVEVWARPSEVPWVMAASGLGNHHCHPQTPCACLFGAVQLCRSKPQSPFWLLTGTPAKTVPKMRFGSLPSEHSRRAEMEVLLLFVALLQEPASSTLYGPRFLSGAVGGSITHQCFYSITPANKHDRKFWCKRKSDGICYTIISTTNFISEDHVGRVALEDVPQNGTFMVTMTQLKTSDTGTYRCGIGPTNSDLHVSLNLTVSAEIFTSPNPARHNSVNPTLPFRSSSNHVVTQSSTTWPTDTTGPTDTMGPTDTTGLRLTTMLAYIMGTRTEGTSPHPPVLPPSTFVTSRSDTYSQSSSGEFSLLSVVIPALVLLIFIITTVLVLTKIKLRKEMGEEGSTLGQTEAVLVRTGLSPTEGQGMEELSSPDNTIGCKAESGRHWMIRALLGRFGQTRLYESFSEKYSFQHE